MGRSLGPCRTDHPRLVAILVTALGLLGSCAAEPEKGPLAEPSDGVPARRKIELNETAVMMDDPIFRVGGSVAEGPTAFGRVHGGVIDKNGRLWIADEMAGHIVRLDDNGDVEGVLGRKGQGPGEFGQVEILGWSGTQVVAYDVEQRRIVVIDEATDESATTRLFSARWRDVPRHMSGIGSLGEYVFIPLDQPQQDRQEEGWTQYPAARVVVESPGGLSLVVLTGPQALGTYFDGRRYLLHPLQTRVAAGVFRDTVALVGTMGGDILMSALDGTDLQAFNLGDAPGAEVGNEELARVRTFLAELPSGQRRFWVTAAQVEAQGLPERRPFFDRLVLSTDGVMWVRRTQDVSSETRSWEVITLGGRHLGTALFPSGENVLAASSTGVATLSRDENNAAFVSMHAHPFRRNR